MIRRALRAVGLDLVRYDVIRPGGDAASSRAPSGLEALRERYPFPDEVAAEPFLPEEPPNGRDLVEAVIAAIDGCVVLEIGSFLGGSTLRWLRVRDDVTVVCVDPWPDGWAGTYLSGIGHPEAAGLDEPGVLYGTFLANVAPYRDRVVPVRAGSPIVLDELHALGLVPDVVFIDATKTTGDLVTAAELWPDARLAGDDWSYVEEGHEEPPMQRVVRRFAERRGLRIVRKSETWVLEEER